VTGAPNPTWRDGPVRWAAGPFRFALTSDDDAVHCLAVSVFRPWATDDPGEPSRAWHVSRLGDHPERCGWRVRSSAGDEIRAPSVDRAVSTAEFDAVGAITHSPTTIVHGALVARRGLGVLLIGRGEAGKSTLACALWARGAILLGDDVAVLDPERAEACPAPRRVSLRLPSREVLGDGFVARILEGPSTVARPDGWLFHPDEIVPARRRAPVSLAAMVFLARRGAVATPDRAAPLDPALALLALLPYTNLLAGRDPGDAIRVLAPLASRVPAFDLGRGAIQEMTASVERLVPGADSSP